MPFTTTVKLAGIKFKNPDGTHRQDLLGTLYDDYWCEPDEGEEDVGGEPDEIEVELRREPDNKHDENAVAIWCLKPEEGAGQIGYVPAENAAMIGTAMKEGRLVNAEIVKLECGPGGMVYGEIRVKLRSEGDAPQDDTDISDYFEDEDGEVYEIV